MDQRLWPGGTNPETGLPPSAYASERIREAMQSTGEYRGCDDDNEYRIKSNLGNRRHRHRQAVSNSKFFA